MRDRLVELIVDAENAVYQEKPYFTDTERIGRVADHILAEGIIVPPCKVGQTVYVLTYDSPTGIEKSRVKRMVLKELQDGTTIKIIVPCVFDDWGKAVREFYPEDFGKTVFLTREEAEKALKGGDKG
jgi:hypothetical protein